MMDYATAKETEMRKAGRIWKHGYQKEEREKERKEGRKMGPLSRRLPGTNRASAVTVLMAFYEYGMGWDGQLIRLVTERLSIWNG